MRKREKKSRRLAATKRKLMSALCMLLVSSILMTTVSYAWLILSTAPEVTGITTNVGANGSLEIALLNGETRQDLSLIRSGVGESLATNKVEANYSWGNLIDLSDSSFGLGQITLMPARVNAEKSGDGYIVDSAMLSVPSYGYDGRIVELTKNVYGATYNAAKNVFSYSQDLLGYGVRALGTSDTLSVQDAALLTARSNISTYTNNASSTVKNSLSAHGNDLVMLLMNRDSTYDDEDLNVLENMILDVYTSLDYIESAIKYGFIAYAASQISDETVFNEVRDRVLKADDLSDLLDESDVGNRPADLEKWIEELEEARAGVDQADNQLSALRSNGTGSYVWADVSGVLNPLMNLDQVYIDEVLFNDFDVSNASVVLSNGATLTLAPGSGVYAKVADFAGNYNTVINVGAGITVTTASTENPSYLATLAAGVSSLEAASGGAASQEFDLTTTYGYAIDLAFRTNAAVSDLLLQTDATQRVYSDSTSGATQGGGSYMEFSSEDSNFSVTQMLTLMDAIRVAFVDDQGNILGIAKLNTNSRTTEDGKVKAPLYLYDFTVDEDDVLVMGERRKSDNAITALKQNEAKAISAVVWLDGDLVDNTMVSGDKETSLSGVLNLQFASSADLVAADNNELENITADKTKLNAAMEAAKTTYDNGQKTDDVWYTTVSWNAFVDAYTYADAVNQNYVASEIQVYYASRDLALAAAGLTEVDAEAVQTRIDEVREKMGTTTEVACYVGYDKVNDTYFTFTEYTEEKFDDVAVDGLVIYRVDYANNLEETAEDGVLSQIYTDESWSNLAAALYHAEAVVMYDDVSDLHLDEALTALDTAYDALQRRVFFLPYDYEGSLYYKAICEKDAVDTYGTWYDSNFNRVVSDLTILNLDAYAEEANIVTVDPSYVCYDAGVATTYVNLLTNRYPKLDSEEIIALTWTVPGLFEKGITSAHISTLNALLAESDALMAENYDIDSAAYVAAQKLVDGEDTDITEAHAKEVINNLQASVNEANAEKKAAEDADAANDTSMTADQRTVLTAAVAAAEAVDGYIYTLIPENETEEEKAAREAREEKLKTLRTEVADAEILLADPDATKDAAEEALAEINTCLSNLGEDEVTAYNTLVYTVPGSDVSEVLQAVEHPGIKMVVTGEVGTEVLQITLITRNGILVTVEREVTVYYPAADVDVPEVEDTATLEVGETLTVTAELTNFAISGTEVTENGVTGIRVTDGEESYLVTDYEKDESGNLYMVNGETIKSWKWSTNNTKTVSLSSEKSYYCTITGKATGSANITLVVVTEQGNTYAHSFSVTVAEPTT